MTPLKRRGNNRRKCLLQSSVITRTSEGRISTQQTWIRISISVLNRQITISSKKSKVVSFGQGSPRLENVMKEYFGKTNSGLF